MHKIIEDFCIDLDFTQSLFDAQNFGGAYQNLKQIQFYKKLSENIRVSSHEEADEMLIHDLEYCINLLNQCNNFIQNLNANADHYYLIINTYNYQIEKILSPHFGYFIGINSKYKLTEINQRAKRSFLILEKAEPILQKLESDSEWIDQSKIVADEILQLQPTIIEDHKKCLDLIKAYTALDEQIKSDSQTATEAKDKAVNAANHIEKNINIQIENYKNSKEEILSDLIDKSKIIIDDANKALEAGTTAGLAGAFVDRANQIRTQMILWSVAFIIGLIGIVCFGKSHYSELILNITNQSIDFNNISLRLLLGLFSVGAPLWLSWLSAKQIGYCFRLEEDYRFKATITKSYLGFSDRAQKIGDEHNKLVFGSTLLRFDQEPLRLIEKEFHASPFSEFVANCKDLLVSKANAIKASSESDSEDTKN